MPADFTSQRLLDDLTTLISRAAALVLRLRTDGLQARQKADATPLTAADEASEAVIGEGLARLLPGLPVISEEAAAAARHRSFGEAFIVVDPLDGTREILAGRDEFAINIALVHEGRPLAGLIAAPACATIWRGCVGRGAERLRLAPGAAAEAAAEKTPVRTRKADPARLVALISRSHADARSQALLKALRVTEILSCGSALKFCRIAEGAADLYPRLAPTGEWDVAAGDALVTAAGGRVHRPDGAPIRYGRGESNFLIPDFVARGDPGLPLPAIPSAQSRERP